MPANTGLTYLEMPVQWERYEPARGKYSRAYISGIISNIMRADLNSMRVQLRLGWHYPPKWAAELRHARFINQYGDVYRAPAASGSNLVNIVFNDEVRAAVASTISNLFADLSACSNVIESVAVSAGVHGEPSFPGPLYNRHANSYWAYDFSGKLGFMKAMERKYGGDIDAVNVSWGDRLSSFDEVIFFPGNASSNNVKARDFHEWYSGMLADTVVWQYTVIRRYFSGSIVVPFSTSSFLLTANDITGAMKNNLSGSSAVEQNGLMQSGRTASRCLAVLRSNALMAVIEAPVCFTNGAVRGSANAVVADAAADIRAYGFPVAAVYAGGDARIVAEEFITNRITALSYPYTTNMVQLREGIGAVTACFREILSNNAREAFSLTASWTATTNVMIEYVLRENQFQIIGITVSYRVGDGEWKPADIIYGHTNGLLASPYGVPHKLVVIPPEGSNTVFRITPDADAWTPISGYIPIPAPGTNTALK
ncbi:MAG: beta-galactosidase [Spirochaetes bacterium]|nr:beta-galactosidase [Spirochaetota bacterium]